MAWTVKPSATIQIDRSRKQYLTPKMKAHYRAEVLPRYETRMAALLPILNDVQERYRCVPYPAMKQIAEFLEITPADVPPFGVHWDPPARPVATLRKTA